MSKSQTQIVYSTTLLSIAIFSLSNLPTSSFLQDGYEEEEEDLLNSRNLIQLCIFLSKILAQTALFSSLLSLIGTVTSRSILQLPLKLQALINLFITSFSSVVLGTLYLSPQLLNSASHQLCLIAIPSDSTSSLSSRGPSDYSISSLTLSMSQSMNAFWNTNISGENCDERASSIILPCLLLISFCNLIHLHLVYVLLAPSSSISSSSDPSAETTPLLPLHHSPDFPKSFDPSLVLHQNEKSIVFV